MAIFYWIILAMPDFFIIDSEASPTAKLSKLLVTSYDGYRYDYFDRNVTPYLSALKTKGIYSDCMVNAFVTRTFSNHHTIATVLYVENHGVVDNVYYDPQLNKTVRYSYEMYHYNNKTLPIWILNEKAEDGRRRGVKWPGNEYEYSGIQPTFSSAYNRSIPHANRIDDIISCFNHKATPINFAMLYIEEPDHHGHDIGINSDRFNQILKKLDDTTRYLHESLGNLGLTDVNVVHLSDHATNKLDKVIDLNKYINQADYIAADYLPVMSIFPRAGKEKLMYNRLQQAARETNGFDVYWKKDIPQRYHYSNNTRIGPILVVNKIGHTFETLHERIPRTEQEYGIKIDENSEFGSHGYDNAEPEMRPFFFGVGPAFLSECKIPPFHNVDLVPLFCDVLNIPQPLVDGTLEVFKKCWRKHQNYPYY